MVSFLLALALAGTADPMKPLERRAPVAETGDEAALTALDERFQAAFNRKDVDAIVSYYADDAVAMDPGPALWSRGRDEIRKGFTSMFQAPGTNELKLHDKKYHVHGDFAWSTTLWTFKSTDPSGKSTTSEGRAMTVFEKKDGKWLAVADHASMPFPAQEPAAADTAKPAPKK